MIINTNVILLIRILLINNKLSKLNDEIKIAFIDRSA